MDMTRIPTTELPTIIASSSLSINVRQKALDEFTRRLKCGEGEHMEYMSGLFLIKECSLFSARCKGLFEMLEERMRGHTGPCE